MFAGSDGRAGGEGGLLEWRRDVAQLDIKKRLGIFFMGCQCGGGGGRRWNGTSFSGVDEGCTIGGGGVPSGLQELQVVSSALI